MKSLYLSSNTVRAFPRIGLRSSYKAKSIFQLRFYHEDGRQRVSGFWIPTGGIAPSKGTENEDSHSLLIRAGFIRQAHAGIFQFLPLGLRVQDKIAQLVDKHMARLGASKLSLSTFSSEELWQKTGRLDSNNSELFRLMDRKGGKFLLSPTHEEEITALVGSIVKSYKDLPIRLYQITRKYRDEPRPRQGLLRTREFLMKDLYTFDTTHSEASQTYKRVRESYDAFFTEFKIPFLTAEAASGEMGGDISHEYHLKTRKGEDDIVTCSSCNYAANEELAQSRLMHATSDRGNQDEWTGRATSYMLSPSNDFQNHFQHDSLQWVGINRNHSTLVQAFMPKEIEISIRGEKHIRKTQINLHAIKRRFPDIDLSVEDPMATFRKHLQLQQRPEASGAEISSKPQILRVFDIRYTNILSSNEVSLIDGLEVPILAEPEQLGGRIDLVKIETGDRCPKCADGALMVESAVELGHTFLLGTRYSTPLKATVTTKDSPNSQVPMQMGCHGIGISRLIAAVADALADDKGLSWPRVIAPFEAVIVPTEDTESGAVEVYDGLTGAGAHTASEAIDTLLDDRKKQLGWKLRDADMIGYPVVIVVGKYWTQGRKCEVQCRRLGVKEVIPLEDLRSFVQKQLRQL